MRFFIKIFITIVFIAVSSSVVFAVDYLPKYQNSIKNYGIGVYYAPDKVTLYSLPDENSKIIDVIHWDNDKVEFVNAGISSIHNVFVAFIPVNNVALFAVDDETDGWCKVFYDQKNGKSAWIKKDDDKFYNWLSFMKTVGKKNNLYFWADLPTESKTLRTGPDDMAEITDGAYYPKNVDIQIVRGNWMLVKLIDFNNTAHVGWLKWRTEAGKILAFPQLKSE